MKKILIVDDQKSSREYLDLVVREHFDVVGLLEDATATINFLRKHKVDVILMDIYTSKKVNGILISKDIKEKYPNIKIIIVTFLLEYKFIELAKSFDIEGFFYKDHSSENLCSIIQRVLDGEKVYPSNIPSVSIGTASSNEFTKKELKVLKCIVNGKRHADICAELGITRNTLNYHIANIKSKTGYDNILKLAIDIVMQKFIVPDIENQ